jgi:hypothetical protein
MKLVCCPRCSHLMIYRGQGRIAKCSRCIKDMRVDRGVGVIPVVAEPAAGARAGTATPAVDVWNRQVALVLEAWSADGTHARLIEVPLDSIGVVPADLVPGGAARSGRYPVPEPILARLREAFA